ncbi:unnamed protein product [Linum tenue]|uniref:Uncharacterized protein n=1 Tax=Linum tenue TaxID=586396 RepID=A0AAV0MGW7_9ROSI|nr:unnamed protein product [Linum tenue]
MDSNNLFACRCCGMEAAISTLSTISFLRGSILHLFWKILLLAVVTLAYCAAYDHSASHAVFVVISVLLFHFLIAGVLLATSCWLYAFDVHCNSFFPMFVMLYVIHYFLSPLLVAHGFIPVLLSNLLFLVAASYYHYLNFLGYDGKQDAFDCSATLPRENNLFLVSNRHSHRPFSHFNSKRVQSFKILHEHVLQSKAVIYPPKAANSIYDIATYVLEAFR